MSTARGQPVGRAARTTRRLPQRVLRADEIRIEADSPFLTRLDAVWRRHLLAAISELPVLEQGDLDT